MLESPLNEETPLVIPTRTKVYPIYKLKSAFHALPLGLHFVHLGLPCVQVCAYRSDPASGPKNTLLSYRVIPPKKKLHLELLEAALLL